MVQSIDGYLINNASLEPWGFLLKDWIWVVEKYVTVCKGDAPYWYNERANTSMLAAAAWRSGFVAVEAYSDEKKVTAESEEIYKGRVDLWIGTSEEEWSIETKYDGVNLKTLQASSQIEKTILKAIDDIKRVRCNGGIGVGVAFIEPCIKKEEATNLDNDIQAFINMILPRQDHAIAWCFPKIVRQLEYKGCYYPGIILIANVLDK
ncbi:MAG: hypothetical protein AB1401_00710 [Thermodesulfobacteriota bacterium]